MISFFEEKIIFKTQKRIRIHKNNSDSNSKLMFVCGKRGLYAIKTNSISLFKLISIYCFQTTADSACLFDKLDSNNSHI